MELSPDQGRALDMCLDGANLFVTGPGGSGKTHLIRTIVDKMKTAGKNVQVCALTGCAAVLLECGARTVHSWAGIGLASGDPQNVVDKVCRNKFKALPWKKTDLLIIDEVSMMSKKLFDILDAIGRKARRQPFKPFGGMQILFSGDFYQLPPVGDRGDSDSCSFCFESAAWDVAFPDIVQLRTIFRQSDSTYVKVLGQVRRGRLSRRSYEILQKRVLEPPEDARVLATQLVPTRREAEAINQGAMALLEGEAQVYTLRRAKDMAMSGADTAALGRVSEAAQEAEYTYLRKNVMVGDRLELKVGAQVMCVANIDMEGPYPIVNGSQGVVQEFRTGLPLVSFHDGQAQVIGRHVWPSETMPGVGVEQLPLIPAWAITIHKAQGVTLDQAEIDAGNGVFECGQTYVALSRVKSLEGLYLTALDHTRIRVNKKVQEFYAGLRSRRLPPPAPATVPALARTTPEEEREASLPKPKPRTWSVEDDAYLWDLGMEDGAPEAQATQEKLGRGRGALVARLGHLRNPRHKAYLRLHGSDAPAKASEAASTAATAALAAAAAACLAATDASGCSVGAWATKVLCEA